MLLPPLKVSMIMPETNCWDWVVNSSNGYHKINDIKVKWLNLLWVCPCGSRMKAKVIQGIWKYGPRVRLGRFKGYKVAFNYKTHRFCCIHYRKWSCMGNGNQRSGYNTKFNNVYLLVLCLNIFFPSTVLTPKGNVL